MFKKLLTILAALSLGFCLAQAQIPNYTKVFPDKKLVKKATKWAEKGLWRVGFNAASPHKSANLTEFYIQYGRNTAQWDAAFRWLASHDLQTIPAGKYTPEGTKLVISVEDSENRPLEQCQSESHRQKIDLQYTVRGIERFGVIEHKSSSPNCEYRPDVIHYDYDVSKARFYDSTPDKFFLFFPSDWHIAKIQPESTSDNKIRVIVVKLDYIEDYK